MRDFLPQEMQRRKYIFSVIESVFQKYGFLPLETPSMEMLSTLTGKYGDEGDQLMFRVLNSGDFLKDISAEDVSAGAKKISPRIAEKALRYDLTIPFARVVAGNQHALHFPFRRYQIQPVWRADRPQKGRYREFYQCDADVVGSDSLILEAELAAIYAEVFALLGIDDISICLNSRKILAGIAEVLGVPERLTELTIALDKLDKIGTEGVQKELLEKNFSENQVQQLFAMEVLFQTKVDISPEESLSFVQPLLKDSETGIAGVKELQSVVENLQALAPEALSKIRLDFTLARGLNYYTGTIFEVRIHSVKMGSIGGGGRYDDLTGMFGLKGMSGVGISFGADRIYDVMEELNLFPHSIQSPVKVLIASLDTTVRPENLKLLSRLRKAGISAEIYPDDKKLPKQFEYAEKKQIPFFVFQGSTELESGVLQVKNLNTGVQQACTFEILSEMILAHT